MTTGALDAGAEPGWRLHPSKLSVVGAVTKRMVPYLIEATIIPTVLFYLVLLTTSELSWALLAALGWSFTAVARRVISSRQVPGLLVLATVGISVRTIIYLLSSSSFVYFLQPILRTVATSAVFAVSVLIGQPLIARFARDFCRLTEDVANRPAIVDLFRRLTYLWAAINALVAGATLALLLTLPVAVFVGTATATAWVLTCSGVVLTVSDAVRTARTEGLATAVGPHGTLRAYVVA